MHEALNIPFPELRASEPGWMSPFPLAFRSLTQGPPLSSLGWLALYLSYLCVSISSPAPPPPPPAGTTVREERQVEGVSTSPWQIPPALSLRNALHCFLTHRITGTKDVTNLVISGFCQLLSGRPRQGALVSPQEVRTEAPQPCGAQE